MSKNAKETFYVTTAIDYATGDPHIGHAYEKIAADTIARWNRNSGKDTFFLTGTDEHGQKVLETAEKEKKEVSKFAEEQTKKFINLTKTFDITNDFFIKTTDPKHKKLVEKWIQKAYDNGDIYKDMYEGLYCVGCERYYDENELDENGNCLVHKKKAIKQKEENYFFKLSKYEKKLLKFYKENPDFISPRSKQKEIINRVKEGLRDLSVSRRREALSWGVEVPFDNEHVIYVWFDALFNYYTALEFNKKLKYWPANVHIIGHDISWFHTVYWPAFLMSVGIEPPKKVFSHGMILDENGHKMSKSLGNVINPFDEIERFGLDEFRFFLLGLGGFGDDINYSHKLFVEKINNDLNNDLGNLVSRVHTLTTKYFGGSVPGQGNLGKEELEFIPKLNIFKTFDEQMQNLQFNQAINTLWEIIRETNAYINRVEPWKEKNMNRLEVIINTLVFAVKTITNYLDCLMPKSAERIRKQYNLKKEDFSKIEAVKAGHKLGEKDNLFKKMKLEEIEAKKEEKERRNKIEAVIFDFDGVIHDTAEIGYEITQHFHPGITKDEWMDMFNGNIYKELEKRKKGKHTQEDTNIWIEKLEKFYKDQKIERHIRKELEKLSKKYPLYIITSNNRKILDLFFENSDINHLFKKVLTAEDHKSKEEKFRMIFDKYKHGKDDCIFITDTLGDILEANSVGVKSIAVDFGFQDRERLEKGNPHKIVSSFKEIRREIETLNGNNKEEQTQEKKQGFASLNLKVGKIVDIEQHPDAEKLFVEKIDIGEDEPRQIVSGLKDYYKAEELKDKKVIVVANLKPAKLRGVRSEGMILAAEDDKDVGVITTDADIGTNLEWNNETADNESRITVDDFFKIKMKSKGDSIEHQGKTISVKKKKLFADKNIKGRIR